MGNEEHGTHVNVTPGLHLSSFFRFSSLLQPSFFAVSIKDGCSSTRYRRTRTARIAVASVSEKRRPMHERAPISVDSQFREYSEKRVRRTAAERQERVSRPIFPKPLRSELVRILPIFRYQPKFQRYIIVSTTHATQCE